MTGFGELVQNEFLYNARERTFPHSNQAVRKDVHSLVCRRVISRRYRRAGNSSRHVGVVDLPASVVALTPHRITDGVKKALLRTARSPKKVTRVLLKE